MESSECKISQMVAQMYVFQKMIYLLVNPWLNKQGTKLDSLAALGPCNGDKVK